MTTAAMAATLQCHPGVLLICKGCRNVAQVATGLCDDSHDGRQFNMQVRHELLRYRARRRSEPNAREAKMGMALGRTNSDWCPSRCKIMTYYNRPIL